MELLVLCLISALCFFLISKLVKLIKKVWWSPLHLQSMMRSQGISGPSYKFIHGNTKEIAEMRKATNASPPQFSHDLFPRLQPHVYAWNKLYGMNFLCWYGSRAQLVITECELIKEVLNSKDEFYAKQALGEFMRILLGDGLVLSKGQKWLKMRKLANNAFSAESVKGMVPTMVECVETMLESWRQHEGSEIEVFREFKVLTSDVIARAAFGSSYLEAEKLFDMLMKIVSMVARNQYKVRIPGISKILKTKDEIESDKLQQEIRDSIANVVKSREQEKTMSPQQDSYGSDFLGLLVKAYNELDKTKKISVDDLIDECKTFYLSGQETTASAFTWTVLLLAMHPDWQEKARNEVFELFGQENPTQEDISKLKTMNMIIHESLRLYPPVFFTSRVVQKEAKLGKLTIPKNMEVYIPILAVHHDPEIWGQDAHLFKPERFAGGVAKATNNNISAFLPFGLGPRTCVGMHFGTAEIKIALSMILQRYRFTLSATYVHYPVQVLTMCPARGLQIVLHKL